MNNTGGIGIKKSLLPSFLLSFFVDQASKFFATIFGFQIGYNSGISLSFFSENNSNFLTLLLGVLICLLFVYFKDQWQKNTIAAGLFFGGAVANVFDRLVFGSVRDWLFIPYTHIQNNLADWAIFAGLFSLSLPIVFEKQKRLTDTVK